MCSSDLAQRNAAELMQWQLQLIVDEEPYLDFTFPLEQMNGVNIDLVENMTVRRAIASEKDAENYLAALGQVATRMEDAIAESRRLAAKKVLPPRYILEATVKQMQNFSDPSPAQNPFALVFANKLEAVPSISEARRKELIASAEKIVGTQIYPAWKKAIAQLQTQLPLSANDAGLWRFKDGDKAYSYYLHRYTTTNLTAEQIHEIGLRRVKEIEVQMDELLRKIGRTEGTVKDRIEKLSVDMRYPNPSSEESRAQIMKDIDSILADSQRRSALLFDIRPKTPVVAQPFPRFREDNAAAN